MTMTNEAPEIGTTDYKDETPRASWVETAFLFFIFYLFIGCGVTTVMIEVINLNDDTAAARFALILFWPAFAVKYLALGGWEVLQAFLVLIQS